MVNQNFIFVRFKPTGLYPRPFTLCLVAKYFYIFLFFIFYLWVPFVQAEWSGNIRLLSDYIYRGYSKSRGNPVIQAHVDYMDHVGWFAGLDFSQVRFDDQPNVERAYFEIKPYVGWSVALSEDWRTDLSVS